MLLSPPRPRSTVAFLKLRMAALFLTVALIIITIVLTGATPPAHATTTDDVTWSVQPADNDQGTGRPNYGYVLDPGSQVSDALMVTNSSQQELALTVYAADGFTTASGHLDLATADIAPAGLGSWITVDTPELTLAPGETTEVAFTLTVPVDAQPGDHPGGIVTSFMSSQNGGQVQVENRLGSRIHVRVAGELSVSLKATDLQVIGSPTWNPFSSLPVTVTYALTNTGNTRALAHETHQVAAPFSLLSQSGKDLLEEITPGSTIERQVQINNVWPLFKHEVTVTITPEGLDGTLAESITATTTVWLVPWPQLALLVIIIGGGVTLGWLRSRSSSKSRALPE